jgi:hypothetical protein
MNMRRLLLATILLVTGTAAAQTTTLLQQGGVGLSCNALTASTATNPGLAGGCTSLALVTSGGALPGNYTWQTITTGAPATISVTLVGSLDNATWTTLDTNTVTTGGSRTLSNANAYRFLGCVPGTLTGGTSPTVSCQISVTSTAGGGGNGAGAGAAPAMAFYLSNQCPTSNTGQCFNTPADTQVATACTWTGGNATVTCAAGTFKSSDVGKTAFGFTGNCNPFQQQPLGGALSTTTTTILTFTDSAHVNMAATASASTAGAGCLIFGHPDDAGAVALSTAIASLTTSPQCPKVFFAAADYMFLGLNNETLFWANPPACLNLPSTGGGGAQGNLFFAAGYEIEGRGPGTTILWLPPDFPETGSCTHGLNSDSCFAVPLEGRWSDLQISGGSGAAGTNMGGGKTLLNVDVGSLDYVTLTNIADFASATQHQCIEATHWAQMQQVNVSACGDINLWETGGTVSSCFRCSLEVANSINSASSNLLAGSGADFACYYCNFYGTQTAASSLSAIVSLGASIYLSRPHFAAQVGTSQFYYQAITTNGSKLWIDKGFLNNGGATNVYGIYSAVTATVKLTDTIVLAAGTGQPIDMTGANSVFINGGGNSISGGSASTLPSVLNLDSQGTVPVAAANAVLSANWGTSAAWSALTGGDSFTGTLTNGTAATGAAPTITLTFPTAFLTKPNICQALQIGGTNATGTFAASALSATAVTFTFSLTPTANSTEIVQVFCQ